MRMTVEGDLAIESLPDLLWRLKITSSKKEGRREIEGEGIYLNNAKIPKSYSQ